MLRHLSRSTAVQLRVIIGILDLEEVGEMLQEVASPNVPLRAPYFPPPNRSQWVLQLRLGCQVASGGGVRSPNGEVVGDRITGGFAKKILLLVQRNQILSACFFPLGFSVGSPPALQLFCEFVPFVELLPVGDIPQ